MSTQVSLACYVALAAIAGCSDWSKPCMPSFEPGSYSVTILERYDEDSTLVQPVPGFVHTDSCGDELDYALGDTFRIRTTRTHQATRCITWRATVVDPDGMTYVDDPAIGGDPPVIILSGHVENSVGCRGRWSASIQPSLEPPNPDSFPPAVFVRRFTVASDLAPSACGLTKVWCSDQYVIQMAKEP
jgi:hypothetical protein